MTDVLSLDQIDELLSTTRSRGDTKPVLARFFDSGELALNVSEAFPAKKNAVSLRGTVAQNLKTNFGPSTGAPNYKLMLVGKTVEDGGEGQSVVLVNMDVYAAQKASAAETPSGAEQD